MERALAHLEKITEKPHYIGSDAHDEVREYLLIQLELLGLDDVQVQEDFTLSKNFGVLAKPKNIIARIPGTGSGKSLLLMAHYDSAPHSASYGASDAGSGVVTILEGVRAYLASGRIPKNDIIILFSDAEEIGLIGASLFAKEHPWAKNIGLTINFEARGSGGASSMILETNGGNASLVKEFIAAKPGYPVANSLMYSIYKMLPNDTDSTIFREENDTEGFFFAFIDDHFDYHTANDTFENLDLNSLAHQGTYITALLSHFSDADLSNLKAEKDFIYFDFPVVKMVSYPFSWVVPMLIIAFALFIGLIIIGRKTGALSVKGMFKGFIPFLAALLLAGLLTHFGWGLLLKTYPHYGEMLHGFTYNGHLYIIAFTLLAIAVCFWIYSFFTKTGNKANLLIAPLFLWLIINTFLALYLKGGAFFIIPVFFGLFSFFFMIKGKRPNLWILLLLTIPAVFIFVPLIKDFPVGLGLKMLTASAVFTVLLFGLLLPVFAFYQRKKMISGLFLLLSAVFFISAHTKSSFEKGREKPNSLIYFFNADTDEAYWATYDKELDDWTKQYLGDSPEEASKYIKNVASSKYGTGYTYAAKAQVKNIPEPEVIVQKDTVFDGLRNVTLTVVPQRRVSRIALYTDPDTDFKTLYFNGKDALSKSASQESSISKRSAANILNYYVSDNDSLEIRYQAAVDVEVKFTLQESSPDLLSNKLFDVSERPDTMIPKPFIITDAVLIQKTISVDGD